MAVVPTQQIPGVYHRRIGDIVVTALSDGFLDGTVEVLQNITPDEARRMLADAFRPGRRTSVNCFAIHTAGRLALVDTGSGDYLAPTVGKLQRNLAAAGIDPAAVEAILLTHMHPDHSAGLTDPASGKRLFPNAEVVVHENEPRHWDDDAAMARASERERMLYFQCAREQIAPYRDRLRPFNAGREVFPGVTSVPLNGHTPGHSGYMVQSGDEALLIWGDIIHVPEIQVPRPEVTIEFDTDPQAAAEARRRTFARVATDRLLIAGMHVHFPGFAHVVRHGDGYALLPEPWVQAF
ncbi:MAG TPA: MBL fold metallo-hydrolase [Acetobacteraceae bacterium]|nr:MBL fold metallo-hydrolase [Acetobacteraceae bacterium]